MSKLSGKSVSLLARSTNLTKEEVRDWHQQFLKECPDGKLCKERFQKNYAAFYPEGGDPSAFTDYIFSSFDLDGSGFIEFREFLMVVSMTSERPDPEDKLHWVFSMYDVDGDGTVDAREMESMLQAFHTLLSRVTIHHDVTSAVGGNHVTCDEPRSPPLEGNPHDWTRVIFDLIDTNSDGVLTREEFVEGCLRDRRVRDWLTGGTNCATEK